MKAPDKIKIVRFSDTKELSDYWVLENKTKNEDIEYIRKDALLEWLQEIRAIPHENAIGRDIAFQEVVNKLNSM